MLVPGPGVGGPERAPNSSTHPNHAPSRPKRSPPHTLLRPPPRRPRGAHAAPRSPRRAHAAVVRAHRLAGRHACARHRCGTHPSAPALGSGSLSGRCCVRCLRGPLHASRARACGSSHAAAMHPAPPPTRPHRDPPCRGAGPDHPVPGHERLHARRARDRRQGARARVHARREPAAARVLPVRVQRPRCAARDGGSWRSSAGRCWGRAHGLVCRACLAAPDRGTALHAAALPHLHTHTRLPAPVSLPSPPDQVQELELSVDMKSLDKLLEFLACE